jgi:hypothetical protein
MTNAHQKRNEILRTQGRPPETPAAGYVFREAVCLTPNCGAVVRYEISSTAPWHLNTDHVICERCAATYRVTIERVDDVEAQVVFRDATDRQS